MNLPKSPCPDGSTEGTPSETQEVERLREKLKKIHNLSLHAWEQVERNPREAQELFKMICFHSK